MPTATWGTSPTSSYGYTAADFQPEPEPRGLFDMIAGTSQGEGSDFSSRLGVLAQILGSIGTGRPMPDIAGQLGAIEDRSARRRKQSKADRMVARAAAKIAERDPELAAAMMADTAFGMQMLGKQYEHNLTKDDRLREIGEKYRLKGINELALQKQKAEAWMSNPMFAGVLERMKGGGTPTADAAPAPNISDVGSIPAPTGPIGTGLEPAPTGTPLPGNVDTTGQPISAQPTLQQPVTPESQQAPQQQAGFDPSSVKVEPFPVARDQFTAMLQEQLSPLVGVPRISGNAAQAIWNAKDVGGVDLATAIDNAGKEWAAKQAADQGNARKDWEYQRGLVDDAHKTALADLVKQQEPTRLQNEYMGTVQKRPFVGNAEQIRKQEVLAREGYSNEDINLMGGADKLYNQVMAGVRGGPDARATQVEGAADDIRAQKTAQTTADVTAQAGEGVATSAASVAEAITSLPPEQKTPGDAMDVMTLQGAAAVAKKDPTAAQNAIAEVLKNRSSRGAADISAAAAKLNAETNAATEARAKAKATADAAAVEEAAKQTKIRALNNAVVVKRTAKRLMQAMYGGDGHAPAYGPEGWIAGQVPGSATDAAEGLITTIESQMSNQELQAIRSESVGGASGYGALQEKELRLLQTQLTDLRTAMRSGKGLEQALKIVWNHYEDIIHPTGGVRMDEDADGFKQRPFEFERDSPGLYYWMEQNGKLGDFYKREKAPENDPLGLGPKPSKGGGADPNDPLGLGQKPGGP